MGSDQSCPYNDLPDERTGACARDQVQSDKGKAGEICMGDGHPHVCVNKGWVRVPMDSVGPAVDVDALNTAHREAMTKAIIDTQVKLEGEHDTAMQTLRDKHATEVEGLQAEHAEELQAARNRASSASGRLKNCSGCGSKCSGKCLQRNMRNRLRLSGWQNKRHKMILEMNEESSLLQMPVLRLSRRQSNRHRMILWVNEESSRLQMPVLRLSGARKRHSKVLRLSGRQRYRHRRL